MSTEKHEVDCGFWYKTENGIQYEGDVTFNGLCYKNLEAWRTGIGVIYIGEFSLLEENKELYWTRENWMSYVKNRIGFDYKDYDFVNEMTSDDKFIEWIAEDCLNNSDWQDLSTTFDEFDYNGDWVLNCWEDWKNKQ